MWSKFNQVYGKPGKVTLPVSPNPKLQTAFYPALHGRQWCGAWGREGIHFWTPSHMWSWAPYSSYTWDLKFSSWTRSVVDPTTSSVFLARCSNFGVWSICVTVNFRFFGKSINQMPFLSDHISLMPRQGFTHWWFCALVGFRSPN